MKWGEQARVLRLIPGPRAGRVRPLRHDPPQHLHQRADRAARRRGRRATRDDLFFAGQISGVEGYVESAASGLIAGRNAAALALGARAVGAAARRRRSARSAYYVVARRPAALQPTNITFGIMPPPVSASGGRVPKKKADRKTALRGARAGGARRLDPTASSAVGAGSDGDRMKEQLDSFLEYLALNDNASAHTVRAYESDLVAVPRRSSRGTVGTPARELTPADFDHGAHPRVPRRAAQARQLARRRRRASWRRCATFGRYLRREGVIDGDPAALVGTPKREQQLPAHLGEAEMSRLLEMPDASTPLGRRDRAILELFYASGLRLSELVGLDLEDVEPARAGSCACSARAARSGWCRSTRPPAAAMRAWLKDRETLTASRGAGRDAAGTRARGPRARRTAAARAAVPELPGRPAVDAQRRSAGAEVRRAVQHAVRHQPARAAALVRDAPARARRRPARDPGAARPRAPQHDAALHARQRRAADRGVQEGAPEGVASAVQTVLRSLQSARPFWNWQLATGCGDFVRPAARSSAGGRAGSRCRAS